MTDYLTDRAQASPDEFISEVRSIARSARRQLPMIAVVNDQREIDSLTALADELDRIAATVESEPEGFIAAISDVARAIDGWKSRNENPKQPRIDTPAPTHFPQDGQHRSIARLLKQVSEAGHV